MPSSRRHFLAALSGAAASYVVPKSAFGAPAALLPIALGIDNFAVRAMGWKAPELIQYAAKLHLDTLFLSDLDCLPSFEEPQLAEIKAQADAAALKLYVGSWSICPTSPPV